MSFSVPVEIACHIRKHKNMSSYICSLVVRDIEGAEQKSLVEQIKVLLSSHLNEQSIGIQLDTLSAIDSLIGDNT